MYFRGMVDEKGFLAGRDDQSRRAQGACFPFALFHFEIYHAVVDCLYIRKESGYILKHKTGEIIIDLSRFCLL